MNNDTKFIFKGQQDHAFENYVKYYIIKNKMFGKYSNDSGTLFASMDKNWDIFDTAIRYVRGREMVASRINALKSAARLEARLLVESNTDSDVIA